MDSLLQLSYLGKTKFIVAIKSLALLAKADELVTSKTLTDKLGVESSFIRKVLAKLMEENIVQGFGGRFGGYKLLVKPEETTLYDIYVALAKDAHPIKETYEMDYMDQNILTIVLESQQKIKEVLGKYTVQDIAKENQN